MDLQTVRDQLDYDLETGIFRWKVNRTGFAKAGMIAGTQRRDGYVEFMVCGKKIVAHRLAFLYVNGELPKGDVDHINGIKNDNRWSNLRDVSVSVNMQNQRRAFRTKQSSMLGAYWHKRLQKWQACIMTDGKSKHIGYFETEGQAHQAYLQAKRAIHPGCTI